MKKIFALILLLMLLAGIIAAQGWRTYQQFLAQPLQVPAAGAVFNVDAGMSVKAVVGRLAELGITRDDWRWRVLLRLQPRIVKTGEYRLDPGITPPDLLDKLERGDVITYRFTLVEGWTFAQLRSALGADPILGATLPAAESGAFPEATALGLEHPEGWFLPETYVFTRKDQAADILRRSHEAMQAALAEAWSAKSPDTPLESPYQLLILASIIEKETALNEERAQVSGVFVRRLQKGMRLQTDPTVIYGMGEGFDGDIRRKDLLADTAYNTYTRDGLPPTPIAMPGRASLMAAAQPAPGESLYFVANGDGGHTFSTTLEEHQRAVNKLLGKD